MGRNGHDMRRADSWGTEAHRKPGDRPRPKQGEHWINHNLRSLYDEVASEPVPDSFKALLDELEQKDG